MKLRRSPYVSFFHRRAAVFAYVGTCGDILEMSADVRDFIVAFEDGATPEKAATKAQVDATAAAAWAETLRQHGVLVTAHGDPLEGFDTMVPRIAPWCCWARVGKGVTVVEGRSLRDPPTLRALDPWESRLFLAIDGELDTRGLAITIDGRERHAAPKPGTLARVRETLLRWTSPALQWTRLSSLPARYDAVSRPPAYLSSTMPYPALGDHERPVDPFAREADGGAAVDNRAYHRRKIIDADQQFDDVETTLAHLFRYPQPALSDRTFGAALIDGLRTAGLLLERGRRLEIVEIGGGTGRLAEAALDALEGVDLRWRIVELSPALRRAQAERLQRFGKRAKVLSGDAESLPVGIREVDLLIANEMIGDLRATWLRHEDAGTHPLVQAHAIELHEAPDEFWLNDGAIRLVEQLSERLAPGGCFWLSEFGHRSAWPVESTQLDHAEVSIHFGILAHVAERVGLEVEVRDVVDVIGLDERPLALSTTQTFFRNLRALAASRGVVLDKRAWTRDALEQALGTALPMDRIGNLRFVPMGERVMGLRPREFLALVGRRPAESGGEQ